MKSGLVLSFLLFMSSVLVYGQLEKGNCFMYGSSSMGLSTEKDSYTSGSTTTESSKSTYFDFSPSAGYFVIDNLPVGLKIQFNHSKTKNSNSSDEYTGNQIMAGPFARYYFLAQEKLKPMAEAYVGFGSSKNTTKYSSGSYDYKSAIFSYSLGAGASYFLTEHVAFDALIAFDSMKYTDKSSNPEEAVRATSSDDSSNKYAGICINLGIVVVIPNN